MSTSAVIPFFFESHQVRGLNISGNPWFVARDVCDVLELVNVTEALRGLDDDELSSEILKSGGQAREMKLVSESGLYTLIIRSNKPQARKFRKWVTAEVLPTIRKTGGYQMPGQGKRADIFHHRRPVTPSGLDIRYRVDLTRIVNKPSRQSLDLLGRLTGLDLSDLQAAAGSGPARTREETMLVFDRFYQEQVMDAQGNAMLFRDLYRSFVAWYPGTGADMAFLPSAKMLSAWLDANGYRRSKPSGVATVHGLILVEEVGA